MQSSVPCAGRPRRDCPCRGWRRSGCPRWQLGARAEAAASRASDARGEVEHSVGREGQVDEVAARAGGSPAPGRQKAQCPGRVLGGGEDRADRHFGTG